MVGSALPVVLLDIDGVCSPLGDAVPASWGDWRQTPGYRMPLLTSPSMGDDLRGLEASVRWLTTWGDGAAAFGAAAFGWDACPVLPRQDGNRRWWKAESVRLWLPTHAGPVVWIDDELNSHRAVAKSVFAGHPNPYLLISPSPGTGLTCRHLNRIRSWLEALSPRHLETQ